MADGQGAGADGGQADAAGQDDGDDGLTDAGRAAIRKERASAKAAQRELATALRRVEELEGASKTELQRALERAEAAEGRAAEAELSSLRTEVAAAKGLPAGMASRLAGKTREELEADADELAALIKPSGGQGGSRRDPDQGRGNGHQVATDDMNALLRGALKR